MASTASVAIHPIRQHAATRTSRPRIEDVAKIISHCCVEERPVAGVLARQFGLPKDQVEKILQFCEQFCLTPKPIFWDGGRNRGVSVNGAPVYRQVSKIGQFSYRGNLYSIGKDFDNCLVTIVEEKSVLVVSAPDRTAVEVPLRNQ
jgi:hypothetical protein